MSTGLNNPNPCLSSPRYDWDVATTFSFLQKYGLTGTYVVCYWVYSDFESCTVIWISGIHVLTPLVF